MSAPDFAWYRLALVDPQIQLDARDLGGRLDGDRRAFTGRHLVVELHVDQLSEDDEEREHDPNVSVLSSFAMSDFQRFRGTDRYLTSTTSSRPRSTARSRWSGRCS